LDLPLGLLLVVHQLDKARDRAPWIWKIKMGETLKNEEIEGEIVTGTGIGGTEIEMETGGLVEGGKIEMTGGIEEEMVIGVEMIGEDLPGLEEMMIEGIEETPDGEETMTDETEMVVTEVEEMEEEMTGTEVKM